MDELSNTISSSLVERKLLSESMIWRSPFETHNGGQSPRHWAVFSQSLLTL